MNQEDLIVKLKSGDTAIFNDVVAAWQDKVYNTAISIVNNEQDAEDVTQEVFISLYQHINEFRQESKLSTWLYKITIRKSLDQEKRKNSLKRGGSFLRVFGFKKEEEPLNFNHPGVLFDNKEKAKVLFQALKKIPEKQRIAFTLNKVEGLNNSQIALIMNTSIDAIDSLMTRAKNNLRNYLEKYYKQNLFN